MEKQEILMTVLLGNMLEFWCPGVAPYSDSIFLERVVINSPVQPTYYGVYLFTRAQGKFQESDDAKTSIWPWRRDMVHVRLHPPQQAHSREINEYPKGAKYWGFDFGWGGE